MPSYEQRPGGWSVRFREPGEDGVEKNARLSGYKTKREAKEAYEARMTDNRTKVLLSNPPEQSKLTFGQLIDMYMDNAKSRLKASSIYDAESKINTHIRPYFGKYAVCDVTPAVVMAWQNSLSDYSYKYKKNLRGYVSAIFGFGNRYYDIPYTMSKVEPIRNLEPKKEMLFWTLTEFKQFISSVEDPIYNCFFRLLYISGCRKGEALALTFDDIDIDNHCISITKSITRKVKGATFAVTTPKNSSSNRKASMPDSLLRDVMALRKPHDAGSSFVFGGSAPLPDRTTDRKLIDGCNKSGVKKIRIHDFRHSCASYLISQGVSIVAVSKRLGHSNIEQTLNTYSHMMPSDEQKIGEIYTGL